VMVGVNKFCVGEEPPMEVLRIGPEVEWKQVERVRERKQSRNRDTVQTRLAAVREAAAGGTNVMPAVIDAVRAECTVGEISDVFRDVFGVYRDPAWI
jgi:methylmalonyl-CoA mutase, N-terminal domain